MRGNSVNWYAVSYSDEIYLEIINCECCTVLMYIYILEVVTTSSKHRGASGKRSFETCSCHMMSFLKSISSTAHTQMLVHIAQFQLHTQIPLFSFFCINFGFHASICSLEVMKTSIWDIQIPIEMILQCL